MRCSFKPYEGEEKYIFVSYAHADGDRVKPILEELSKAGFRIWFDEGIEWGTEWPEYIATHIRRCDVFMMFLSEASVASSNCRQEINYALKKKRNILPLYLEFVELSDGIDMQLTPYQSTFAYQYDDPSEFYERLTATEMLQGCRDDDGVTDFTPSDSLETERAKNRGGQAIVLKFLGEWGDKVVSLYEESTQTLYIKGTGTMWWYAPDGNLSSLFKGFIKKERPWDGYSIKTVEISEGIEDIGIGAFCDMPLEGVSVPNSVTMISRYAFSRCRLLKKITVPKGVESIAEDAFEECTALKEIHFLGTESQWEALGLAPEDINHAKVTFAK